MIAGSGFNIRHVRESDLDTLIGLLNNLDSRGEFLPTALQSPHRFKRQYQESGLSTEQFERLVVEDDEKNIIGTVWHFKAVPYFNAREIGGVSFDKSLHGQGKATHALVLMANHLFNTLHINRLELRINSHHKASKKIADKCGFTFEGVSRGANFLNGKHIDMDQYSLLRNEWQAGIAM
jgi:ribosomal-protein-alanine N-acetyltransferase